MEYFDDLSIHTDTIFMWVYVTFWFQQFIFLSTSYREVRHYCFVNYVYQAEEKQLRVGRLSILPGLCVQQ